MRRILALWLVLAAAYAATSGVDSFGESDYGGAEPHHLLAAESLVGDGDLDLADDYRERTFAGWFPYELEPPAATGAGAIPPPHGAGFPLLVAPAYALGGPTLVELLMAALAALGFALGAALARRVVPEPWASRAALVAGLSAPALAQATAVSPEAAAGAVLAGAAILTLRARESPQLSVALPPAALIALLPWLGPQFAVAGVPLLGLLLLWLLRRGRTLAAVLSIEVVAVSLIAYTRVNESLYGSPAPPRGQGAGAETVALGGLERAQRPLSLLLDRDEGLLRWAPVLALAFVGAWALWRSLSRGMARMVPERREAEAAAALALLSCLALWIFVSVAEPQSGRWFPTRDLAAALPLAVVPVAWGLRHVPRVGWSLGGLTLLASAWLLLDMAREAVAGWAAPASRAPWGPLVEAFPDYGSRPAHAAAVSAAVALGLLALGAREWREWRAPAADRA